MLHVFKGEILTNMTQVSDVTPGPLVKLLILFIKGFNNIIWNPVQITGLDYY
jgi:hypothetical protein